MLRNLVKTNQKFIKHILFSYGVIIFNIVSSIYSIKEIITILDKDVYGLWIVAINFVGLLGILNFGFHTVAIFQFTHHQNNNTLNKFFSGNFYVIISQIILTLIGFIGLFYYSSFIVSDYSQNILFKDLLILLLPSTIFNIVSVYFEAVLYYNLKFIYQKNFLELLRIGITNLLFVFVLKIWPDVKSLGYVNMVVSILILCFTYTRFLKNQKIELDFKLVNSTYLKYNLTNALAFWILNMGSYVISQIDVLFISSFKKDLGLVTMYSQSFRLQEISLRFIKKIAENKGPKILALYNDRKFDAVIDIFNKLIRINLILSISAFIGIFFLGKIVLEFWLGNKIIFDQTLISVLGLLSITGSLHWVFWNFCNLTGQQNKVRIITVVEVCLNLCLSYFLINYLGIIGLGIASLTSNSITIIYMYILFNKFKESA